MSMFVRQRSMCMFTVFCILFGLFQVLLLSLQRECKPVGELGDGRLKLPADNRLSKIDKRHVGDGDTLASYQEKKSPQLGQSLQLGHLPQLGQSPSEQRDNQNSYTAAPQDLPDSYNTFSSPLHRHWEADCPAIFSGDKQAVRTTYEMLQKERLKGNGSVAVPSDGEVRTWTRDCHSYKRLRRFPTHPGTDEEAEFQVAYIIVAHKEAAQVERLLRAELTWY